MFKLHKHCLILIIILCNFVLHSCKKEDDIYYSLNDETRGFFLFDVGKTFKLKNTETGEVLNFTVTRKNFYFETGLYAFGPAPAPTYCENGILNFTDDSNCYKGEIHAAVDVKNKNKININLEGCFDGEYYQEHEYYGTIDVLGTEYQNSYLFPNGLTNLLYSKEKGILEIVDWSGEIKYHIVE